jgi:hypothetical protein
MKKRHYRVYSGRRPHDNLRRFYGFEENGFGYLFNAWTGSVEACHLIRQYAQIAHFIYYNLFFMDNVTYSHPPIEVKNIIPENLGGGNNAALMASMAGGMGGLGGMQGLLPLVLGATLFGGGLGGLGGWGGR